MPPLVKNNKLITKRDNQQANKLLGNFFLPLLYLIAEEPATIIVTPIKDLELTLEEVKRKIFSAKLWKALDKDSLPVIVWR